MACPAGRGYCHLDHRCARQTRLDLGPDHLGQRRRHGVAAPSRESPMRFATDPVAGCAAAPALGPAPWADHLYPGRAPLYRQSIGRFPGHVPTIDSGLARALAPCRNRCARRRDARPARICLDVQQNALANYSFVIPRFLNSTNSTHATDGLANSQHAPQDARYGDNLVADVYEALRSNLPLWANSCLIVTYDEHGGFYDHVVPPQNVPNPDGKNSPQPSDPSYAPAFTFNRLGIRVPAVIASPWVLAGKVDSTQYQHTSVLATLKAIFGLRNFLTLRDKSANSFEGLFNELAQPRNDTPATLPRAPLPQITVAASDPTHPANQPLDRDQRDLVMSAFHLTQRSQPKTLTAASLPMTQGEAHDFVQQSCRKHFGPPGKPGVRPKPVTHR